MRRVAAALAGAVLGLAAGRAAAAPLEAYGMLPTIRLASVSPGGERLAMVVTDGALGKVMVQDLRSGRTVAVPTGKVKVRGIDWAGGDHLIVSASKTSTVRDTEGPRAEFLEALDLDAETGKLRPLLNDLGDTLNAIFDQPEVRMVDGKPTVFLRGWSYEGATIFRVDLAIARAHFFEAEQIRTDQVLLGADGHAVALTTYQGQPGRWTLKTRPPSASWKESRVVEAPIEHPAIAGLGRDGASILVADVLDEQYVYREVAVADGAWGPPLPIPPTAQPIFDPGDRRLIGYVSLDGDDLRHEFFEPKDRTIWAAVTKLYPGEMVRLISWSADRSRIVVLVDSPTEGPAFALVDLGKHAATWLGGVYGPITPSDVAVVRTVDYTAGDGLPLHGYLTLPRGAQPKNLPLVVLPHAWPDERDTPGFDWWSQALASRGYAVLRVNFRGSGGLGRDFQKAGFGQLGRKMQTDLSDGVRHLSEAGIVDPKRVCIVGVSYGGFAALVGVALEPAVYRCAVSVAGPSDLPRMIDSTWSYQGQRYWLRLMGGKTRNDDALSSVSPAKLADRITAPVLLIHGRDDTVVPLDQSYYMANALKRAGKRVEFLELDGADHWLSSGETRLATLQSTVAFLEKNNPAN